MTISLRHALVAGITVLATALPGAAGANPATPRGTLGRAPAGGAVSPAVLGSGNLVNHGGSLENTSTNYLIFWGVPASPNAFTCSGVGCIPFQAIPSNVTVEDANPYAGAIERFFRVVGGTPYYGILTQYGVSNATTLGGVYSDLTNPAVGTITETAIEAEVRRVQAATGWTGGIGHNFWVITGPGAVPCGPYGDCAYTSFCGYHWTMSDRAGIETPFAVIPYPEPACDYAVAGAVSDPNLTPAADSAINVISHELFETVTDPGIGFGDYGWYDSAGYEIADKCAWIFGPASATGGDVTLHGVGYMLQQEYSNSGSYCRL